LQLPRNQSIAWTADLDGDGSPEWVLESPHARAIFTAEDGGRWLEFTWKDTDTNFLPETGLFGRPGGVEVRVNGSALEFTAKDWRRTVRLSGNVLSVEQNQPIADGGLAGAKRGNVTLKVTLPAPNQALYTLEQ
jgi:hypothetical protein